MNAKYEAFLKNTKELTNQFGIIPLLYGSLGLEVLTNTNLNADDIDILIPEKYVLGHRWSELKTYLESTGYTLIDHHEHTFLKNNIAYSYASIENLDSFAGIKLADIGTITNNETTHLLLSLDQYLAVYQKSSTDGYRANKKEKNDNAKILFIKAQKNKTNNSH